MESLFSIYSNACPVSNETYHHHEPSTTLDPTYWNDKETETYARWIDSPTNP